MRRFKCGEMGNMLSNCSARVRTNQPPRTRYESQKNEWWTKAAFLTKLEVGAETAHELNAY